MKAFGMNQTLRCVCRRWIFNWEPSDDKKELLERKFFHSIFCRQHCYGHYQRYKLSNGGHSHSHNHFISKALIFREQVKVSLVFENQ
jgi:hypothetical protein